MEFRGFYFLVTYPAFKRNRFDQNRRCDHEVSADWIGCSSYLEAVQVTWTPDSIGSNSMVTRTILTKPVAFESWIGHLKVTSSDFHLSVCILPEIFERAPWQLFRESLGDRSPSQWCGLKKRHNDKRRCGTCALGNQRSCKKIRFGFNLLLTMWHFCKVGPKRPKTEILSFWPNRSVLAVLSFNVTLCLE